MKRMQSTSLCCFNDAMADRAGISAYRGTGKRYGLFTVYSHCSLFSLKFIKKCTSCYAYATSQDTFSHISDSSSRCALLAVHFAPTHLPHATYSNPENIIS
ncbi:MAG: hypothetical protein RR051_07780, partial [Clostridiales bacterium]